MAALASFCSSSRADRSTLVGSGEWPLSTCVPANTPTDVGSERSEKTSQSARITSWAESSASVVVCTWGRLRNDSATSISS